MVSVIIRRKLDIVHCNGTKTNGKQESFQTRTYHQVILILSPVCNRCLCAFVCPADKIQNPKDRKNELKAINAISFWHQTLHLCVNLNTGKKWHSLSKFRTDFHSSVLRKQVGEKKVQSNGFAIAFELLWEHLQAFSIYLWKN